MMAVCILSGLICTLAVGVVKVVHPLPKGGLLLALSICVGICVGKLASVWLGLILVVVYAGGMLVLFCYVCCLAPSCLFSQLSLSWFFGVVIGWIMFWESITVVECCKVLPHKESWSVCLSVDHYGIIPFLGCVLCVVLLGACKMSQIEKGPLRLFRLK
uniref:NADH dehydrogenase subunit 6 n=1 Tax=Anadara vellicata TaxID=935000 RepID=A0A0P0CWC1_9BIVA|nr:NADH dehydrogenase subunit 6 [Anadara vellicata]